MYVVNRKLSSFTCGASFSPQFIVHYRSLHVQRKLIQWLLPKCCAYKFQCYQLVSYSFKTTIELHVIMNFTGSHTLYVRCIFSPKNFNYDKDDNNNITGQNITFYRYLLQHHRQLLSQLYNCMDRQDRHDDSLRSFVFMYLCLQEHQWVINC